MDYCVMCGSYVPEGSMVCKQCWVKIMGEGVKMERCVRCGKILKTEKDKHVLELVKHTKPFFTKKVVKRDLLCDECIDEYNKFFIGE